MIDEIKDIKNNTKSNLYYFYTSKNILMYSRRHLVSNFNKYFNIDNDNNKYDIKEIVSKKTLEVKEENDGSIVRYNRIFCASKYLNELSNLNLIIDFTDINDISKKIILDSLNDENLCNLIDSDYYFLEHDIKYKVGDLNEI